MADAAMPVNNAITAAFAKYSRIPEYDQYIPVSRRTNRLGISSAIKEHIPTARTITQPAIQKTFFLAGNLICMPQWMETRIMPLPRHFKCTPPESHKSRPGQALLVRI